MPPSTRSRKRERVEARVSAEQKALIERAARLRGCNLSKYLVRSAQDQMLAQDIQERVINIFESCNFQDLTGQRIAKVVATLKFICNAITDLKQWFYHLQAYDRPILSAAATSGKRKSS